MMAVHAWSQGGNGFLLSSSGSAWSVSNLPWYDVVMLRAADLTEAFILYPLGYCLLFWLALVAVSHVVDDPRDGEVMSTRRKLATFGFLFGAPLVIQVTLALWYHHLL